ncbi:MAG TPA: hypothetical protein VNJ08_08805 [Bacteriovoracaceae bacterium]|nr:hypothetical protein [Bacteriovoracaceae bacterium]
MVFKSGKSITIFSVFLLSGCAAWAWKKYDIPVQPDYSCQTGLASGYDIWVWNCYNNQHIVVYQATSEMSRREGKKQTVPCGELTKIEEELKLINESSEVCNKNHRPKWGDKKE